MPPYMSRFIQIAVVAATRISIDRPNLDTLLGVVLRLASACSAVVAMGVCAQPQRPLEIAVSKSVASLPVYVAEEKGYFAEQGVQVTISDCFGGHRCMRQLFDGTADVATATEMPVMLNSFERTDYAVIATIATTSDSHRVIARSGLNAPMHLTNKRLGAVIGTSSQYFLELYLLTVGIDPRTLEVVPLQPEGMLTALRDGKVDAVAIWEPYASLVVQALGSKASVLPNRGGYIQTFNLVSRKSLFGSRDGDLAKLLRGIERAEKFINDQPAEAKAILRKRLQLNANLLESIWPANSFRLGLDQSLVSTMEGEARWAMQEGHVKGRSMPNFLTLLHTAPLEGAKPSSIGVGR